MNEKVKKMKQEQELKKEERELAEFKRLQEKFSNK